VVEQGKRLKQKDIDRKIMSRKLRARKTEENGIGQVFERVVEEMRNEMSTVLWRIERSRDGSPEALKKWMRTGLEAMVGAVEKVMYGVSDGLAKEWKEKEQQEEVNKARNDAESREGEERKRKTEESWKKIEDRLERKLMEAEERWKESEERLKNMEKRLEKEVNKRVEKEGMGEECTGDKGGKDRMDKDRTLKERVEILEDKMKDGVKHVRMEDRVAHERIDKLESEIAKDKIERQEFEWNEKEDKEIQDTKDSEREMEKLLEGSMKQLKILNMDFGRQCTDRRMIVKEAISNLEEKMVGRDRDDFDRMIKGTRVDILGEGMRVKETEKGQIHMVPLLITCGCRSVKDRMEVLIRKTGINVSFQWPKECLDFVDKIREEAHKMGYDRKEYYMKVRPAMVNGRVFLRAEIKKKDGRKFEGLAYWRAPPRDKEYWKRISKIVEPEWRIVKQSEYIGL
jgi:hypothetical protein